MGEPTEYSWAYSYSYQMGEPMVTSYTTVDYGYGSEYDDDGCYLPTDDDADAYEWEYSTEYSWGYSTDYSWDYSNGYSWAYSTNWDMNNGDMMGW
jgi:hypothetical protein